MVSILPQKYVLDRIVDGRFDVECMLEKGGSPETYEPSMSQMMKLEKCKAYFLIGNMGFEETVRKRIGELEGKVAVVNSIAGIGLIRGHHHLGKDEKEGIDPHVWMSAGNMRRIARNMTDAVVAADRDGAAVYEANFEKLDGELAALDEEVKATTAGAAGKAFVVWHPSLSYFARDYGLEQVSVEYDGKEAPIKYVESRIAYAKMRGASVFLMQAGTDSRHADVVAGQLGIRSAEINPLGYDWQKEMKHIADELSR